MGDKTKDDAAIKAVLESKAVQPIAEAYRTALQSSANAKICSSADADAERDVAQAQQALKNSLNKALGKKAAEPYGNTDGRKHPTTLAEEALAVIKRGANASISYEGEVALCNTQVASASQPQRGGQVRR